MHLFTYARTAIALLLLSACHISMPESPEQLEHTYTGKFRIINSNGIPYEMEARKGQFSENGNGTLDIVLREVSFSPRMPLTLDLLIPAVPYQWSGDELLLYADSIIPVSNAVAYPQYTITSLTGTISPARMHLLMDIGGCPSEYDGEMPD